MKAAAETRDSLVKTPSTPDLQPQTQVEIKCNRGTWHIYTPNAKKCVCGSKLKTSYSRNTNTKTRTIQEILENPDKGLIGSISRNGLRKLKTKVKQQ